ncbi:hypothetical protein D3C72_1286530 [compost metagenome]
MPGAGAHVQQAGDGAEDHVLPQAESEHDARRIDGQRHAHVIDRGGAFRDGDHPGDHDLRQDQPDKRQPLDAVLRPARAHGQHDAKDQHGHDDARARKRRLLVRIQCRIEAHAQQDQHDARVRPATAEFQAEVAQNGRVAGVQAWSIHQGMLTSANTFTPVAST